MKGEFRYRDWPVADIVIVLPIPELRTNCIAIISQIVICVEKSVNGPLPEARDTKDGSKKREYCSRQSKLTFTMSEILEENPKY